MWRKSNKEKECMFLLSMKSFNIIGNANMKLGVRKSSFVDQLIQRYGPKYIEEVEKSIKNYNEKEEM